MSDAAPPPGTAAGVSFCHVKVPNLASPSGADTGTGPWLPPDALWAGNGKQALALVAARLRDSGCRSVLVPAYCCETMMLPFQLEGLHIEPVDVGDDLLLEASALETVLARCRCQGPGADPPAPRHDREAGDRDQTRPANFKAGYRGAPAGPGGTADLHHVAILHAETYGNRAGTSLSAVLADAQRAGARVVLDATHSLLDGPSPTPSDWAMASLRKLLPVPDGAWVTGLTEPARLVPRTEADEEATRLGTALQDLLSQVPRQGWRQEGSENQVTALLARIAEVADTQESLLETCLSPTTMAPVTRERLAALTASGNPALRRRAVAGRLRDALSQLLEPGGRAEIINPGSSGCVALRTTPTTAGALRRALAQRGLWGPVAWDGPPSVVTLPTDQPARVGELINVTLAAIGVPPPRPGRLRPFATPRHLS